MLFKFFVLFILMTVTSILCDVTREKRGKHKSNRGQSTDRSLWKKEYENELTDAMLLTRKHENHTRVPQSSSMSDNEAVIEKLMETITSSEKYLKKVDSIDFRLNRLDLEVHEKSNSIMKQLSDISKAIVSENSCGEKLEPTLEEFRSQLSHIRFLLDKNVPQRSGHRDGADYHGDNSMETRLSIIESEIRNIQTGVESIVSTISDVKNRQSLKPITSSTRADPINGVDAVSLITEFRRTIREGKAKKCDCKSGRVDRSERYPTDCHEILVQGFNISGIYKIRPDEMEPFYVLCDLTTAGGGWTVFQNRFDGSQDFYKGWHEYEYGFGNLAGEFWLGLEKLNYLTNQKLYELRIELETQRGQEAYAGYSVFTIGPEREGYRISTLGSFYGTAGDSLSYHAGQKFSTLDVDNDEWKDGACATEHGGAWWYKECDKSNLNGKYTQVGDDSRGQSIYWMSFKGAEIPLIKTKMMIRPLPASKPVDYVEMNRKLLETPKLRSYNKMGMSPDTMSRSHGKNVKSPKQYRYDMARHDEAFFPSYT